MIYNDYISASNVTLKTYLSPLESLFWNDFMGHIYELAATITQMISKTYLIKEGVQNRTDIKRAFKIAEALCEHLNLDEIQEKIKSAHKIHASSQKIQEIFIDKAEEMGFTSERKKLFLNYNLRPDYYIDLENDQGIIIEVERGKTLANNMDLLDIWKCHICPIANILFLIVPNVRQTNVKTENIFPRVVKRVSSFFEEENHVNVDAIFIFGY
jgi:hypothetical protein